MQVSEILQPLDDIDCEAGLCEWSEVANARDEIGRRIEAAMARDLAYNEAKQLSIYLHRQHYADSAPNWQPLSDLRGVISQIDNMVVGLVRKQEG